MWSGVGCGVAEVVLSLLILSDDGVHSDIVSVHFMIIFYLYSILIRLANMMKRSISIFDKFIWGCNVYFKKHYLIFILFWAVVLFSKAYFLFYLLKLPIIVYGAEVVFSVEYYQLHHLRYEEIPYQNEAYYC